MRLFRLTAAALLVLALGFGWGFQTHRTQGFPYDWLWPLHQRWVASRQVRPGPTQGRWGAMDQTSQELLVALGYAEGSKAAPPQQGVVHWDPAKTWGDLNLYTSGHGAEAILVAMDGQPIHRWSASFQQAFPEKPQPLGLKHYWQQARLLANGELLALWPEGGVVRLAANSQVIWSWLGAAHHDLRQVGDAVWVLTHAVRRIPERHARPIVDDALTILDAATGAHRRTISLYDAFARSDYNTLLRTPQPFGDVTHANAVVPLVGHLADRIPAFSAGRALISFRNLDALAVLDLDTQTIVWASKGPFDRQHAPQELPSGRLLLYDNQSQWPFSRAMEWDPASHHVGWTAGEHDATLASQTSGAAHRLPGGNTLVVASDQGQAVEITPGGERVWGFVNPARAGQSGEYIAVLFDVQRHTWEDVPPDWRPTRSTTAR